MFIPISRLFIANVMIICAFVSLAGRGLISSVIVRVLLQCVASPSHDVYVTNKIK